MKCPHCDQDHPEGTSFCPTTGKLILSDISCPNCGKVYDTQLAACPSCGTPMVLTLPYTFQNTSNTVPTGIDLTDPIQEAPGEIITIPPEEPSAQPIQAMESLPEQEALAPPLDLQPNTGPAFDQPISAPAGAEAQPDSQANLTRRKYILGCLACGCVGLPLLVMLLVVLLVLADPFNLHIVGRVNGSYDAAAEVMPANTGVYMGLNLGNALLTRVDRKLAPFSPLETTPSSSLGNGSLHAPIDPSQAQQASIYDELIQTIRQETGVKIPEDITPWVGQYAGVGAVGFNASSFGSQTPTDWIIALEARNITRADAFLETLQGNLAVLQKMTFSHQTYKGVLVTVQEVDGELSGLSFGRSGRMVLVAANYEILKDTIDHPAKQGLTTQVEYNRLIDLRPRTWSASLYMSHEGAGSLAESVMQGGLASSAVTTISPLSSPWSGMLLSVTAIQEGVQIDGYSILDVSSTSAVNDALVQKWYTAPLETIQLLPQETVIYLANSRFELFSQSMLSYAISDPSESSIFFDIFEQTFGFSLKDDLLDHLNGQWAIYVVPSTHGLLLGQEGINMAVGLLVQTDNQIDLQSMADKLNYAGDTIGISVSSNQLNGSSYFALGSVGDENPILLFSQGSGYFTLATGVDALQTSTSSETSLVNSAGYQKVIDYFPAGMQPSVYVDITGLLTNLQAGMEASELESFYEGIGILDQIDLIASANRLIQPGIAHSSIVVITGSK